MRTRSLKRSDRNPLSIFDLRHSPLGNRRAIIFLMMVELLALLPSGCASLADPNVPEPIRAFKDPTLQREYLLYRPSAYTRERTWPLIVVCHGGFPDSPNAEIRDWDQLAERYGFLVLAPRLTAAGKPGEKLRDDETHLLDAVQHVRAGHSVSEDRILMFGVGTGACTALGAALRQPDLFRAVAVTDPRLTPEDLLAMRVTIDPYQPIYLRYNANDVITGRKAQQCVDALRANTPNLRVDTFGSSRQTNAQRIVEFFQDAVRNEPWLHVRALPADSGNPREVQFKVRDSFTPDAFHWQFGDGAESTQSEPVHAYQAPGAFAVRLVAQKTKGPKVIRNVTLRVPELSIHLAPNVPE
jgi:pimeloyl-ACP methyl ester carboxylesterase